MNPYAAAALLITCVIGAGITVVFYAAFVLQGRQDDADEINHHIRRS